MLSFRGDFGSVVSPDGDGMNDSNLMDRLRKKSMDGALRRYGEITPAVRDRLEYELDIIGDKGFGGV